MKTFKSLLLLALVFFAGLVVGVVATRAVVRHVVQQAVLHPEKVQTMIERKLARRLRLDSRQEVKLHEILSDAHGQLKDLRQEYRPQFAEIVSNANEQITAILTPEQQARFEKLKQENRPLLRAIQQAQ
jgi:Spy/CpxP family protein refolding chaperone